MLKRNLLKASFFTHGLFLLMPNVTALKGETVSHTLVAGAPAPASFHTSTKDSLARPASDSVEHAKPAAIDSVAAPVISLNRNATKFVSTYVKKEEEALALAKARSKSYFKMIDEVFSRYGLPVELKYLAVVESDLKTNALSRVGAKGMWQFMPSTARDLGLKISRKTDERTHAYKSTVAAAKYLKDLYSEYGDWLLVLAAYNGGPLKVNYAIKKSGSRNFWVLQHYLPAESRGHVKRFIGTHYYFEGKGSLATLTKNETAAYNKAVTAYESRRQVIPATITDSTAIATALLR